MQFLFILIGYPVGSIPFGWMAVKLLRKEDIRHSGSGATGATNVGRKLGVRVAIMVATLDILKAFIPTLTAILVWPDANWLHVLIPISVSLGHSRSLFLGFKGGKAVSTSAGGLIALAIAEPNIGIVTVVGIGTMILVAIVSDFMSFGSLSGIFAGSVMIVIFLTIDLIPTAYGLGLLGLGAWIYWTHIENIKRLMRGQERKLNFLRKVG